MIDITDKGMCNGCTACASICPKQCITMVPDDEGFLYPKINFDKCINCHLCENVCRVKNPIKEYPFEQKAYVVQSRDKNLLMNSTSGGFFAEVAKIILEKDGWVYGVIFNDQMKVIHYGTNSLNEVNKFQGSKYVQSELKGIFNEVKNKLDLGQLVLFNGTPCQVEGLYAYLGKRNGNLITIDNVCHSIPSPLVWKKYCEMQKEKFGVFDDAKFRDKLQYGYEYSQMALYRKGKCIYHKGVEQDYMLRSFFSDMAVRPSCYKCSFKKQYRVSDITMWDCFEPQLFAKELDNNRGVTRVLVHSKIGDEVVNGVKDFFNYKEVSPERLVENVKEMRYSVKENKSRKEFFELLNSKKLSNEDVFRKMFPYGIKQRANTIVRKTLILFGIYTPVKRVCKRIIFRNRD